MIQLLILAGGLGTRLNELTKFKPKSMIEINNKPFINYQLSLAKSKGIEEVVLCVGHLGKMIKDYVGDGSKWELKVSYSFDGEKQLGTAGAIKKALNLLDNDFFILYGDSYLDVDYKKIKNFYFKNNAKSLMTIIKNENNWDRSNVILKKNNYLEYNKLFQKKNMNYIDYGLSILNKNIFIHTPTNNFSDLSDIYNHLSNSNDLLGYEVFNRFFEIGSRQGIEEIEDFLSMEGEL